MKLAEISQNNPLKVIHSQFEYDLFFYSPFNKTFYDIYLENSKKRL